LLYCNLYIFIYHSVAYMELIHVLRLHVNILTGVFPYTYDQKCAIVYHSCNYTLKHIYMAGFCKTYNLETYIE